ncbi:MAG: EthD domain-containing protein [Candidatus Binatia bacterium]|nr:EthD domain-containing protein [Candidatus Binatia bacterium]
MEKLVYCLWRPEAVAPPDFASSLRTDLADDLEALGAIRLRIFVADGDVAAGAGLRLSGLEAHKEGFVSFWLETSQDRGKLEERIAKVASRVAGYLVVESRPMVAAPGDGRGARSPGWVQVTGIAPKDGISYEQFLSHWYGVHRQVAIDTQSSTGYVRNEIVRPLTDDAPGWSAIVEETFPIGALNDPRVFYDAQGSEERFKENARKMFESVEQFLSLEKVDAHPMSEYVYGLDG